MNIGKKTSKNKRRLTKASTASDFVTAFDKCVLEGCADCGKKPVPFDVIALGPSGGSIIAVCNRHRKRLEKVMYRPFVLPSDEDKALTRAREMSDDRS